MKRRVLISFLVAVMLCFATCAAVIAEEDASSLKVTGIFGAANGWQSNANWIGFTLNQTLDLSTKADVILYYEYVENGTIKQMRDETSGAIYSKDKSWSGYLNTRDEVNNQDIKYSSGAAGNAAYSNVLPADTVIMSNIANAPTTFPALSQKIASGEVAHFRVRLVVYDKDGTLAYDGYTNWIQYTADLSDSAPRNLKYDLTVAEVANYVDPFADALKDLPGVQPSITIEGGGRLYAALDEAVAAAKAGDKIVLAAGAYIVNRQLLIDKELTISGAESTTGSTIQYIYEEREGALAEVAYRNAGAYPIIYATAPLTMRNVTIKGPTPVHYGIDGIYAVDNLTLTNVSLRDIRCTADGTDFCGVQYGRGVLANGSTAITIADSEISNFQKNAIDVNDVGHLTVTGSTLKGVGKQGIIAQNGVVMRGSTQATIVDNTIGNLIYAANNEWNGASAAIYLLDSAKAAAGGNTIGDIDNAFSLSEGSTLTFTAPNNISNVTNSDELQFTITFNYQGATGGNDTKTAAVTYGTAVGTLPVPSKDNHTFSGWFTSGGAEYTAATVFSEQSNMTLYAKWTENYHTGYIMGYADGSFQPEGILTRAQAAVMLYRLSDAAPPAHSPFEDVRDQNLWYYDAIVYLYEVDMITGEVDKDGKRTFRPEDEITRAEFMTLLARFGKLDITSPGEKTFTDVAKEHWAYNAITRVADQGWVIGYTGGICRPAGKITRAETVTALNRFMNRDNEYPSGIPSGANRFRDITDNHWAYANILEASTNHYYNVNADGEEIWTSHEPWSEN